jgi:hypothetical protein
MNNMLQEEKQEKLATKEMLKEANERIEEHLPHLQKLSVSTRKQITPKIEEKAMDALITKLEPTTKVQ